MCVRGESELNQSKIVLTFTLTFIAILSGCGAPEEENLVTIKGSDTLLQLTNAWAEAYMDSRAGELVTVSGGGSGVGIAAIINGTTDICMASRDISEEEKESAAERGIDAREHDVALDGIAIVVNKDNPIETLTMAQLKSIFTGEVTSWVDINGFEVDIVVLSRESSSGTFAFFSEHVLGKQDYTEDARLLPSTTAIVDGTMESKGGIGYVGLGYAEARAQDVKVVPVKESNEAEAIVPSVRSVQSGDYAIARALHFYTDANNPNATAKAFIEFCLSAEGQKIVADKGFVPVN